MKLSEVEEDLKQLSLSDACRTLEAFTAESIVRCLKWLDKEKIPSYWILYGDGWNNPVIKKELTHRLVQYYKMSQLKVEPQIVIADEIGWQSQAIEAKIFAYLGVRSLKGLPTSYPETTGVPTPVVGGESHVPKSENITPEVNLFLNMNPLLFSREEQSERRTVQIH